LAKPGTVRQKKREKTKMSIPKDTKEKALSCESRSFTSGKMNLSGKKGSARSHHPVAQPENLKKITWTVMG